MPAGSSWSAGSWVAIRTSSEQLLTLLPRPGRLLLSVGAVVVDGVAASELTDVVPPALAGAAFQRGLTAALRLAYAALPATAVEAVVGAASSWVHGTADATVSHTALVAAAAAAAAAASAA